MMSALLWRSLGGSALQCLLCAHFCRIADGTRGQCGVRENRGGRLYSLSRGAVAALHLDPVEKKPLFHFLPGTTTLSLGTPGCNLGCLFCQNANLSVLPRLGHPVRGQAIAGQELVRMAMQAGARSLAYTYSEPTIFFELMAEAAEAACAAGLQNILVSNGFQSPHCLQALGPLMHAANIDLKAFSSSFYRNICQARLTPVLRNLVAIKKLGWHLEVTTLVIPGLNDSDKELTALACFVARELGADTPWHVSRFHPCHQLTDRPATPLATLRQAWEIGRAEGLWFVFVGNVPGSGMENTVCPGCGTTVMERAGFTVERNLLRHGACPDCGQMIVRPEYLGQEAFGDQGQVPGPFCAR